VAANADLDFAFLSVAADVSGAAAARPFHEIAGATFTTVVDLENEFGRALDYKIIPNGLFVDERGVLQGKWLGFAVDRAECLISVAQFRQGVMEPFERVPETAVSDTMTPLERELVATQVRLGAALKALERDQEAADEWAKALLGDSANFVLRKQVWLLRFPERFHPTIDFAWQKEQLAREHAEEEARRRSICESDACILP